MNLMNPMYTLAQYAPLGAWGRAPALPARVLSRLQAVYAMRPQRPPLSPSHRLQKPDLSVYERSRK